MKEKVSIFIEGLIQGEEESSITTKAIGSYRLVDGRHVIRYKETDDENGGSDNIIEISPGLIEMIKKGEQSTHMVFDLSGTTHSVYDTPYGSLMFQVNTTKINIDENKDEIKVDMEYNLSHNNSHISDNHIKISVKELY